MHVRKTRSNWNERHWTEPKKHFAESILSLQQQHQLLSQIPIGLTFHPKRVGAISRTRRRDSDSFRNLIWSFRVFFGDEKSEFFFGSVLFVSDPICRFRWFSQDEKCIRYFQSYFYRSAVFVLKFLSFNFFLSSLFLIFTFPFLLSFSPCSSFFASYFFFFSLSLYLFRWVPYFLSFCSTYFILFSSAYLFLFLFFISFSLLSLFLSASVYQSHIYLHRWQVIHDFQKIIFSQHNFGLTGSVLRCSTSWVDCDAKFFLLQFRINTIFRRKIFRYVRDW